MVLRFFKRTIWTYTPLLGTLLAALTLAIFVCLTCKVGLPWVLALDPDLRPEVLATLAVQRHTN